MNIKKIDVPNELFEIKKDFELNIENEFGFKKNDVVWIDFSKENNSIKYASSTCKFRDSSGVLGLYVKTEENYHLINLVYKDNDTEQVYSSIDSNAISKTEKQSFLDRCDRPELVLLNNYIEFVAKNINKIPCRACNEYYSLKMISDNNNRLNCRCTGCGSAFMADRLIIDYAEKCRQQYISIEQN